MDPDLCCRIRVSTADGTFRGTGYAFAPDRIVTAWHVIADAFPAPDHGALSSKLTISFGSFCAGLPDAAPIVLQWADPVVDVAILKCEFPKTVRAIHFSYALPHRTPIEWHGQGYTQFAKDNSTVLQSGLDGYDGSLIVYKLHNKVINLAVSDGMAKRIEKERHNDWAGGSGTVVFTKPGNAPLAVVTHFFGGKDRDHLLAVPFWYLMEKHEKSADFRKAIFGDLEAEIGQHREWVIARIEGQLTKISDSLIERIRTSISAILECEQDDPELTRDAAPDALARLMVTRCPIVDMLSCLTRGLKDWKPFAVKDDKSRLAKIADFLLPFNYQPGLLGKLKADSKAGIRLIQNIASKGAIADVLMAGIEAKEASFCFASQESPDGVVGSLSMEIFSAPEDGHASDDVAFDRGALLIIGQLLALVYLVPDSRAKISPYPIADSRAENRKLGSEQIKLQLKSQAVDLIGKLKAAADDNGRSNYCILKLPDKPEQRRFVCGAIDRVTDYVPDLWFVELIPHVDDPRQAEIAQQIYYRIVRAEDPRA